DCPFGAMPLMADTLNPYADGQAWKLVPMPDCSGLGQSPRSHHSTWDLQFQIEFCSPTTGVGDGSFGPRRASVRLAGPNPARGRALLEFTLDQQEAFDLTVVDVSGRRVASLGHGVRPAGRYGAEWDGRGDDGSRQP